MAVSKDSEKGTWTSQIWVEDWQGKKKHKKKRGFATKKEALEWEHSMQLASKTDMNMKLADFVDIYFRDKEGELKQRTVRNKKYMIDHHVIPTLGNRPLDNITPADIIQWQNSIRSLGFKETYNRMLQNQLTALFNHAARIYGLKNNPCSKVKRMGKSDADKKQLQFWTIDEFNQFVATFESGSKYHVLFDLLFYSGCRIGEALALTSCDIDFIKNTISITKTYFRHKGQDEITKPKTEESIRTVIIPKFLAEEIKAYVDAFYQLPADERIFPIVPEAVQHVIKSHADKAGVKKIRVHDVRHSHCAYLIHRGVQPMIIKERLGHKDIKITLNTYGHLYPSEQEKVAEMLDRQWNDSINEIGDK